MAEYVGECCFKRFVHPKTKNLQERFEHMHPDVHKGAHNHIHPALQLGVGLELIEKWTLRYDDTQVVYNTSLNSEIGFASDEHFGLLEAL